MSSLSRIHSLTQCASERFLGKLRRPTETFQKSKMRESEMEAVLQRLDRLTQDEARMTAGQTLGVARGLVGNMRLAMGGAKWLHDSSRILF